MKNKDFREYIFQNIRSVAAFIAAVALIVVQQIYYPYANLELIVNILLVSLNLVVFVPLLKTIRSMDLVFTVIISAMALLYNVYTGNAPAPAAEPLAFLTGICGVWIAMLAIELVVLVMVVACRLHPPEIMSKLSKAISPQEVKKAKTPDTSAPREGEGHEESASEQSSESAGLGKAGDEPAKPPKKPFTTSSKLLVVLFIAVVIMLPFLPKNMMTAWFDAAISLSENFYGDILKDKHPAILFFGYLLMLFVVAVAVCVILKLLLYFFSVRKKHGGMKEDFFAEYSQPIILLLVTGALVLTASGKGLDGFGVLDLLALILTWLLVLTFGIIGGFIVMETASLILKQCMETGSLLKTAMRLVFTVLLQYAVGVVLGILRIFALRDVIESILLFFMPDLKDSIEPEVNRVMSGALKREVQQSALESSIKFDTETWQRRNANRRRSGYRRRWK